MNPVKLGIALGDVTGIGPEVTLKALAAWPQTEATKFVIIGDWGHLRRTNETLGLHLPLERFSEGQENARLSVLDPLPQPLASQLLAGDVTAARAAVTSLREGAQRCLRGELEALITAPVSKESIIRAGYPHFVGQTEFLSELGGTDRTAMMLLGCDEKQRWLRVVLATTHVPLKAVSANLTEDKIHLAIELADRACRDLGLPRRKVAVCGLNPHAGEGGKLGDEEQNLIGPAVEVMRKRGFDVAGPFAADALFYYVFKGDYDAVVAMYHDQGLVPLKMIGFETGVNWTLGLPFIRTSPDHGTAYDIAGLGRANPASMISAMRLAQKLALAKRVAR